MGGFNLKFSPKELIDSLNEDIKNNNKISSSPVAYGGKVIYEKKRKAE